MKAKPKLGPRAITAYNRFSKDLAALNYVLRVAKPSGMVGDLSLRSLNRIIHTANRLFRRAPDIPHFVWLDLERPLTVADFAILVTRLTAAALAFEERYAHLTEAGLRRSRIDTLRPPSD